MSQTLSPAETTAELLAEAERQRRLRRAYGATLVSALLLFASFHPLDAGFLAWVALVPWLYVAATEGRRVAAGVSYATTVLYHVVGLSWIGLVSQEGWLITSLLEGFYGVALALLPLWVRRRTGTPLVVALPLIGTGLEWLRGNTPVIRFPWLLLGHSQHANETLIQVADLTSVYGLTFLVLVVNGAVVDLLLLLRARWVAAPALPADADPFTRLQHGLAHVRAVVARHLGPADRRRALLCAALPLALVGASLVYGAVRRGQVEAARRPGPRVLVMQPDFPQSLKDAPTSAVDLVETQMDRTTEALIRLGPDAKLDAIVWSETMWPWALPDERSEVGKRRFQDCLRYHELHPRYGPVYAKIIQSWTRSLQALADRSGAVVLVGAADLQWDPRRDTAPEHNSVFAVAPRQGVIARYDKINLVPASEYVPGENTLLFHWLYELVRSFVPKGFTVFTRGEGPVLMPAGEHRIAPNICFEISFPELLRESVRAGATAHVCPANDGWFVRGGRWQLRGALALEGGEDPPGPRETAELPLARDHAIFRAIESRRPVVRCVNRGVSLVVDPTGDVREEVTQVIAGKERRVGVEGTFVTEVWTTDLRTFYIIFGDAFALACGAAGLVLAGCAARGRRLAPDPDAAVAAPSQA